MATLDELDAFMGVTPELDTFMEGGQKPQQIPAVPLLRDVLEGKVQPPVQQQEQQPTEEELLTSPQSTIDIMPRTEHQGAAREVIKQTGEGIGAIAEGIGATGLGVMQTGIDLANVLGADISDDTWVSKKIDKVNAAIKEYETKYDVGEGKLSAADIGRFIPTLATLGIGTASKVAVPAIEGLVTYAEQRGADKDKAQAAITGAFTTLGVYGTGIILDTVLPPTAKAIQKHLQKEYDLSDAVVDDIFKNYQMVMNVKDTAANRSKAIVDALGSHGKDIKLAAFKKSPEAAKELRLEAIKRGQILEDLSGAAKTITGKIDDPVTKLQQFADMHKVAEAAIKNNYTQMKDMMPANKIGNFAVVDGTDIVKTTTTANGKISTAVREKITDLRGNILTTTKGSQKLLDATGKTIDTKVTEKITSATRKPLRIPQLEEALQTSRSRLKEILSEDLTPKSLVDASKLASKLQYKASDPEAARALGNLRKTLEDHLKNNIDPAMYNMYKLQQREYGQMLALRDHAIGKVAKGINTKTITPKEGLSLIRSMQEAGEATFENVKKVVGDKASADFEKLVLSDAFENASGKGVADLTHYNTLNQILQNKGFVSKEGKAFQQLTDIMERSFSTDDLIRSISFTEKPSEGFAATIGGKLKFWVVQRIWPSVKQRIPYSQVSKHALKAARLEELLARPATVKTAKEVLQTMPEYEKQLIRVEAMDFIKEAMRSDELKNVTSRALNITPIE